MDGRTSLALLTIGLLLSSTGCITLNKGNVTPIGPSSTNFSQVAQETPIIKKAEPGPKRNPQPLTEIKFGELKEADADSDGGRRNPEMQAQLRDSARKAYQHALKIDPNNLEAHRHLARLYVKQGEYEKAFELYRAAMAKHPKEGSLWYDLGLAHHRRKELPESVRCFAKAIELDPENRDYQKKMGFTLAWMGRMDEGLSHLIRAQGAALAHCNIARILIEREDRDGARRHVQIALRENRDLPEAQGLAAWLENPTAGENPAAARGPVQ